MSWKRADHNGNGKKHPAPAPVVLGGQPLIGEADPFGGPAVSLPLNARLVPTGAKAKVQIHAELNTSDGENLHLGIILKDMGGPGKIIIPGSPENTVAPVGVFLRTSKDGVRYFIAWEEIADAVLRRRKKLEAGDVASVWSLRDASGTEDPVTEVTAENPGEAALASLSFLGYEVIKGSKEPEHEHELPAPFNEDEARALLPAVREALDNVLLYAHPAYTRPFFDEDPDREGRFIQATEALTLGACPSPKLAARVIEDAALFLTRWRETVYERLRDLRDDLSEGYAAAMSENPSSFFGVPEELQSAFILAYESLDSSLNGVDSLRASPATASITPREVFFLEGFGFDFEDEVNYTYRIPPGVVKFPEQ